MADRFRAPVLEGEELPRWLFVDMNSYFASVEQQEQPHLRGKPVIVVPMMTNSTCAIAASYEAKKFGVKTGTNVGEAKALCPDLHLVPARHDVYLDYHYRIVEEVERHLHVTKVCSVDEMACLLMGDERQTGKARALAQAVKDGIRRNVGEMMRSSVGLAPTRFLAKVASDLKKPDGLTLLRRSDLPGPLLTMSPMDFPGIGARMNKRLAARGIATTQRLWELTREEMRIAWGGRIGERFWYGLHGFDVAEPPTRKHSIGHSRVLAPDLRGPELARLMTRRLLLKAATRMRREGYHAGGIALSLRLVNGQRLALEQRIDVTSDNLLLLRALDRMWASLKNKVPARKTSVVLFHLEKGLPAPDLFTWQVQSARMRGEKLSRALDTLNARYGREFVTFASKLMLPEDGGVKIAFSRIPDRAEIRE